MKKFVIMLIALFIFGFSASIFAEQCLPADSHGNAPYPHPDWSQGETPYQVGSGMAIIVPSTMVICGYENTALFKIGSFQKQGTDWHRVSYMWQCISGFTNCPFSPS